MSADEIGRMIGEYIAVGYAMAVKQYEPVNDDLRVKDVERWLSANYKDLRAFRRLVKAGEILPFRKGAGANSPLYYSKADILAALAKNKTTQRILSK